MNVAIGTAGVALGLVASVVGALTIGYGLVRRKPELLRLATAYALLVLLGGILCFVAMERALITRDFTVLYVAENGSTRTPALYNFATLWGALEGSIILWATILGRLHDDRRAQVPPPPHRPTGRLGGAHHARGVRLLLPLDDGPRQPLPVLRPAAGLRRTRTQPAAAEPPADGLPPADALPRLRGVHGAVRLRHRRPGHRPGGRGVARGDASLDRHRVGLPHGGDRARRAGGATRCSGGAATGPGTRWRTPRSCRGSPARPTCTR